MGLCWIGIGHRFKYSVPSYADIKAKVDSWLDALTFEKDTITFEKGSFAGPEDNIVLSIVEGEDIPTSLRLREVNTNWDDGDGYYLGSEELYFNGQEVTVSADGELQGYNGGLLSGGEAFNQSGKNYISFSVSDSARSVIFQ